MRFDWRNVRFDCLSFHLALNVRRWKRLLKLSREALDEARDDNEPVNAWDYEV